MVMVVTCKEFLDVHYGTGFVLWSFISLEPCLLLPCHPVFFFASAKKVTRQEIKHLAVQVGFDLVFLG